MSVDSWYTKTLVCPVDKERLISSDRALRCPRGHEFPIVRGIPVMLRGDVSHTIDVAKASYDAAWRTHTGNRATDSDDLYLDTVSVNDAGRRALEEATRSYEGTRRTQATVDPVASYLVAASSGYMYRPLVGKLRDYPIPDTRLPPSPGERLLDVGCSWGRWSIAAARKGYDVVGIDPSLGAVLAAARICRDLGVRARFVVGDARHLPFPEGHFDRGFSYSVIQHFSREDAVKALSEIGRVLSAGGRALIQMPNMLGVRSLYHQARLGFRKPQGFDVRYWRPSDLKRVFEENIGPCSLSVDCYFGLGLQASDRHLMQPLNRVLIDTSELLRKAATRFPGLGQVADSLYVQATKQVV